jgi:hypothetical protein
MADVARRAPSKQQRAAAARKPASVRRSLSNEDTDAIATKVLEKYIAAPAVKPKGILRTTPGAVKKSVTLPPEQNPANAALKFAAERDRAVKAAAEAKAAAEVKAAAEAETAAEAKAAAEVKAAAEAKANVLAEAIAKEENKIAAAKAAEKAKADRTVKTIDFLQTIKETPGQSTLLIILAFAAVLGILIMSILISPVYAAIGIMPVLIVGGAMFVLGILFILMKIPGDVIAEVVVSAGTIGLIILLCLVFIRVFCLNIQPYEMFESGSTEPTETTEPSDEELSAAEQEVCALVKRADEYIEAGVGQPGQENPALVTQAKAKAVNDAAIYGQLTECPPSKGQQTLQAIERIDRMERRLLKFVEPILLSACQAATICSKDMIGTAIDVTTMSPVDRLAQIQKLSKKMRVLYLDPMDQKIKDLQGGSVSDSDKAAAQTNMSASGSGP